MPLAAVGLFIMTLGVLATLNLGQAVHEKIKLQNTADAAAYSLAAMEARTFNYIAFLNRAQIAHYNTAMVAQSYMTWVGFQVALSETATDLLITLKNSVQAGANLPYPANVPYNAILPVVTAMALPFELTRTAAVSALDAMETIGHQLVAAMSVFNKDVVWQAQMARAVLLNGHLTTAMMSYVHKNDPDIRFGTGGAGGAFNLGVNAALNSLEYYQSFSSGPGVNPFWIKLITDYKRVMPGGEYLEVSDNPAKDAYRVMSELCHASRSPRFVSDRMDFAWSTKGVANLFGLKYGQTRFTEDGDVEDSAEIQAITDEGNQHYLVPRHLSSDDFLRVATGFATMGLANVFYIGSGGQLGDAIDAYENEGEHYRYKGSDSTSGTISPKGQGVIAFPVPQGGNISTHGDSDTSSGLGGHAPWAGFAPFFTFKPNSDRTADFGQPSTWMILNKSHKEFQSSGQHKKPWFQRFTWQQGPQTASLDTTVGGKRASYLFEGLNVVSRGMAYYHRPGEGNWKEHPNFFNPFWRARLAPVGQKLQAFWDRYVTGNISTRSDSAVVQGLVAVLKGAQMDLFTSFITSLVTH
jgi:Flp pilus assembly protein TadG